MTTRITLALGMSLVFSIVCGANASGDPFESDRSITGDVFGEWKWELGFYGVQRC